MDRVFRCAACVLGLMMLAIGHPDGAGAQGAKSVAATCDRGSFRTLLDVGHTAAAPGAISARGVGEFDFNLWLARRIETALIEKGFVRTILFVRTGPNRTGLLQRVSAANATNADLLISIHHDSVPDMFIEKWEYEGAEGRFSDRFRGHSIFVSALHPQYHRSLAFGRRLGLALKERGLTYTPHYTEKFMAGRRRELVDKEAGVYRFDKLIVLLGTKMPAVLLEAGSIINRDEELLMQSPERQALIADAVVEAVEGFCAATGPRRTRSAAKRSP